MHSPGVLTPSGRSQDAAADMQHVLARMRNEIDVHRSMWENLHAIVDPLANQLESLCKDFAALKQEVNLTAMNAMFVTNARFTAACSDLKMEITAVSEVAMAAMKGTRQQGASHSGLQAMGQSISQDLSNSLYQVPSQNTSGTPRDESVTTEITIKINELRHEFTQNFSMKNIELRQVVNQLIGDLRREFHKKLSESDVALQAKLDQACFLDRRVESNQLDRGVASNQSYASTSMLNTLCNDTKAEVKRDIAVVFDVLEHTVLKAGFLALSAVECSEHERNEMFEVLVGRERALTGRPAGLEPVVQRPSLDTLATVRDLISIGLGPGQQSEIRFI